MKKRITKIWGVGLVVVVLASLLAFAAPVSAADPLIWNSEVLPSGANIILASGTDIYDFAIAGDGTTIYAVGANATSPKLWKSSNAGSTWVDYSAMTGFPGPVSGFNSQYVAVAPDDPNYVVVADGTASAVSAYVSTNGGSNWSTLGTISDAVNIYNVAISSSVPPGVRYVALPGDNTTAGGIYYYNLGAAAPSWKDATSSAAGSFDGAPTYTTKLGGGAIARFHDIAFSPNFSADYTAVAISQNASLQLHILSFNLKNWDQPAGYPATVIPAVTTVSRARTAMAPDYVGSDDVSRVTFTAVAAATTVPVGGVFRLNDSNPVKVLMSSATNMNSVAFDGTTLVAGAYASNTNYKSTDALATTPTVVPSRTNKRIGLDDVAVSDQTLVAFSGTNVLGAKRGNESCFATSADGGTSWNDISLIDTAITNIGDVYVTPDSAKTFFVSDDGTDTSVFRRVAGTWVRVLTLNNANVYMLRGAPETADAIYVGDTGATSIYFASDSGENRWYAYVASGNMVDMAAESKSIVYIAVGATVRKSSNSGFTWGSPVSVELSGDGAVATLVSLGTDKLLAGGNAGHVSWSVDGNKTWVKQPKALVTGATNVQATATGLDTGNYIFAASSAGPSQIYRWTVGDTPSSDWKILTSGPSAVGSAYAASGIAYIKNTLYVMTQNGTDSKVFRSLNATAPGGWEWSATGLLDAGKLSNITPSDLKASMDGTNVKLWYVNTATDSIRSFIDALVTGPALNAPIDKFQNPMNPVTGRSQDVTFQWPRPVDGVGNAGYQLRIYNDAAGMNTIADFNGMGNPGPAQAFTAGPFQPAFVAGGTGGYFEWTPGMTYYWRVRVAQNGPIYSAWSEMRSLTVQPGAALVPNVISPTNGTTITNTTPAFSWSPISGATNYRFQLGETVSFAAPLVDTQLPQTAIEPAVKLEIGKTYFWRVKAVTPVEGDWSTIANVTIGEVVEPTPPVVIQQNPAPIINLPPITMPPAVVNLPPAEPTAQPISSGLLWAVIIIGAVLVIALIVLIVRTRRTV